MKKINFLFTLTFILMSFTVFSQAVEKGVKLIDIYYGWPNLWSNTAKSALTDANSVDVQVGSLGPFGGKLEYMVSDKVGAGVEINYANTSVKWTENTTDGNGNNVTYNYDFSIPRMRVMFCFNLHFGGSENFDGFWRIGAGYSSLSWKYTTNDPNYNDEQINFNIFPIAFRTAIGGRYFFSENFGLNAELGLGGGPLVAFGISSKF